MTNETTTTVSTPRAPELVGQIVVVIGGSAGIGLETARRARAEGADVVLRRTGQPFCAARHRDLNHEARSEPAQAHRHERRS